METRAFNRRLGRRVEVRSSRVGWRLPAPGERERRHRFRARAPQEARLLDISVSGLRVLAAPANDLSVGAILHISLDGAIGPVKVRNVLEEPGTAEVSYGLELTDSTSPLTAAVHRRIEAATGITESHWDRAATD